MSDVPFDRFGKLLRQERDKRHLSLRAASKESGVQLTTFYRAEQGSDLTAETMLQLARWATGSNTITFTMRGGKLAKVSAPQPPAA